MITRRLLIALTAAAAFATPSFAQDKSIVVSSTTSTQDSGLFGHILPIFKAKTGIDVKVVSQGTGQALDTGRRGDADVLFVHAKPQEEKFIADGAGDIDPSRLPQCQLGGVRARSVTARNEWARLFLDCLQRGSDIFRPLDAGRVVFGSDQK